MARKLKYVGKNKTKSRHVVGWFTRGAMVDGSEFFVGAPTRIGLARVWGKLSSERFVKGAATKCRVYKHS